MNAPKTYFDPELQETFPLTNEGQKVIYQLRRAYKLGSLAVSHNLPADLQKILNTPLQINRGEFSFTTADEEFLKALIQKVESGQIKLFTPSTLINDKVYQNLTLAGKAKADFDVLNVLNRIREVKKLWDSGEQNTYQILNLVHSLRLIKERIESSDGDVFII